MRVRNGTLCLCVLFSFLINSVWAADDGKTVAPKYSLIKTLHIDTGWPKSVAFSPDGKHLAVGNHSFPYQLFDVSSDELLHEDDSAAGMYVSFSPDGKAILASVRSGKSLVRMFDAASGKPLRDLKGHTDDIMSIAVSPDGKQVVSASMDGTARLWDAATGETLATFKGHKTWATSVAFSPDGKQLASTSNDGTLRLWDVGAGRQLRLLKPPQPPDRALPPEMRGVAWSPDGRWLTSTGWDKNVHVWDARTGKLLHNMPGHVAWNLAVAISPDGRQIASSGMDRTVRLWDPKTGKSLAVLTGHRRDIWGLAFSPDGALLASASDDQTICFWLVGAPSKMSADLLKQEQSLVRSWKMRTGATLKGELLGITGTRVEFKRDDGRIVSDSIHFLSKTDQERARRLLSTKSNEATEATQTPKAVP